jgi:pimeloyl-ACP methyl ester carboxylesterase
MPGEQIWEAAETTHIGEQAIHYVTSGSGDAVLLLHGLTGDHSGWVDACTRLHPWEEYARHAVPFYFSPPFFMEHPEKVAATERLLAAGRDVESYLGQNEACRRHDTFDRLGQIRCPTLVVGGGRDMICSPVTTRELTEGIPNAIGEHFGEAGHFLSLEEPSRFLRMLEEWLGRFCDLTDRGE